MSEILPIILEAKKRRIEVLRKNKEGLLSLAKKSLPVRSFKESICREGKISLIGEVKQASPSAGVLRKNFSHVEIAKLYESLGISAVSVLTEEEFFLGKIKHIEEIRQVINIPILRKDFILDEVQILEARAVGADAILLIMRILDEEKFMYLYSVAKELGMDVLAEVHTEKELRKVIALKADIIGINNRNLSNLTLDLTRTQKLVPFIPAGVTIVSESGIKTLKDMLWLKGLGVDAALVGEVLMKSENIEEVIKELNIDH